MISSPGFLKTLANHIQIQRALNLLCIAGTFTVNQVKVVSLPAEELGTREGVQELGDLYQDTVELLLIGMHVLVDADQDHGKLFMG